MADIRLGEYNSGHDEQPGSLHLAAW